MCLFFDGIFFKKIDFLKKNYFFIISHHFSVLILKKLKIKNKYYFNRFSNKKITTDTS